MSKINGARTKKLSVKVIAYTAVLTALSALANIFTVFLGVGNSFAVSFSYIPTYIAGAFFGPLSGFLTGILGDLIGCILMPKGALNPIILFSSGLLGLLPGVLFYFNGKLSKPLDSLAITTVSFFMTLLICTNLNTLGMYLFYFMERGKTFWAVFVLRTPKQVLIWAINYVICMIIHKPISKLIKIPR